MKPNRYFVAVMFIALHATVCAKDSPLLRFQRTEIHMAADFGIVLYASDEAKANAAFQAAFAVIKHVDDTMSDYKPESELSRLSAQSPTKSPVTVSDDLWTVLFAAQAFSEKTDGAFDVTVGPLTRLWRRARRQKELPEENERRSAMEAVGYQHLRFDEATKSITLARPKMRLDLGGIAQGHAADRALTELRKFGITRALVDASGDVAIGDPPPGEKGWKVGIAPLEAKGKPDQFVQLSNRAISTSGDAFQAVEVGGVRYSHIVDPKTGIGLTQRSSVTVVAPDTITADALATALSVLGPEKGSMVLRRFPDCEARWVVAEGTEVRSRESSGFAAFRMPK